MQEEVDKAWNEVKQKISTVIYVVVEDARKTGKIDLPKEIELPGVLKGPNLYEWKIPPDLRKWVENAGYQLDFIDGKLRIS